MSFLLILVPTLTSAHPGRTDSNGGHYCRTNCAKWGLKDGEYHYHNGGSNSGSKSKKKSESTKKIEKKKQDTKTQKKTESKKKDTKKTNTTKKDNVTTSPTIVLPSKQSTGTLRVYYFDVDQGDSTLIITPKNQTILIDGGNNNQGKNVVKYLNGLGIKSLDVMIATHPDADHVGGLDDVLKAVDDVKSVYAPKVSHNTETYKDFLSAVKKNGRTIKTAEIGVSLNIDGVTADFLAPLADYGDDLNAWSAVLKVNYKNTSFLFVGDAETKSEGDMLANAIDLKADVLKVGHHGAKTSTSKSFIYEVLPKYSIISVGKNNYGHPDSGIIDRLKNVKSTIYRTDKQGTITAISDGDKISFVTTKK